MSSEKILLLDSGDTRLKWAWLTAAGLEHPGSTAKAGPELRSAPETAWTKVPAVPQSTRNTAPGGCLGAAFSASQRSAPSLPGST